MPSIIPTLALQNSHRTGVDALQKSRICSAEISQKCRLAMKLCWMAAHVYLKQLLCGKMDFEKALNMPPCMRLPIHQSKSHLNLSFCCFRCIPKVNQVPVLMLLPYPVASRPENRYKIEGYLESIFEGRRQAGQTLNSLFDSNGIIFFIVFIMEIY